MLQCVCVCVCMRSGGSVGTVWGAPGQPTSQKSHSDSATSAESDVHTMCFHAGRSCHSSGAIVRLGQHLSTPGMRHPDQMCRIITTASVA